MIADSRERGDRDRGAVLLLVLAVAIVLSLVILALANFVAADLRYAQIVDASAVRLASAEGGIDYAVDRLRLNQTLCATDVASSAVGLAGSGGGTALPQQLNGTNVSVMCQRLDGAIADVAGWAVVIANDGTFSPPNDQIQVSMNDHAHLSGPVFLPDPTRTATDGDSRIQVDDGDLWYTKASCASPYSNSTLATAEHIDIYPTSARGGICTPLNSGDVFSEPPVPTLPLTDVADPNFVDDVSGCRVFTPGRYDTVPDLGVATDVYFKSGDYQFDFGNAEWLIDNASVWAGYPESPGGLGNCDTAANDDLVAGLAGGRPGATFYFDGDSRLRLEDDGRLEIFPRVQGNHVVSIQALSTSTTANTWSLIRTRDIGPTDLVIYGLVWAPNGRVAFDNDANGSVQKLLGGVVAQRLWILRNDHPGFEIRPATSTVDTRIRLVSTSTSVDGVTTTVEAIVQYRPQAPNPDQRVAVSSFRVVD